jgi:rod shape-determining protein MreC
MRRHALTPYLLILGLLLLIMSLPINSIEKFRGNIFSFLAPAWNKAFLLKRATTSSEDWKIIEENDEITRLHLENHLLRTEISQLTEILHLQSNESQDALPARVIYRSLNSWNSSLWINVGEADNAIFRKQMVMKNSPVTLGTAVVGVIDYVGKHQSRVRLITDTGLTPSVRALREEDGEVHYLAKGELQGSYQPQGRTQNQILHGVGFNYDFSDEYGPARDLRTGFPVNSENNEKPISLLQPRDLLITTGMDGIFPPGLEVATILEIFPLKEGDYTYSLTARPVVENLNDLSIVFVIQPIGYDEHDEAPLVTQ